MLRTVRKFLFTLLTLIIAFITVSLLYGDSQKPERPITAERFSISAKRLPLPAGNADIATSLSLRLTDVWDLNSASRTFGGLSALHASGSSLTFMADNSAMIRVMQDGQSRRWTGIVSPLPAACRAVGQKERRDTESMISDRATGTLWIGFEVRNGVCRIASAERGGSRYYNPDSMEKWPQTGGAEAMVRLAKGGFLIFAERPRGNGPVADVVHFDRDPVDPAALVTVMTYRPPSGYRPVDAVELPDGRILVLNRRFQLPFSFSARLSIIDARRVAAGLVLTGPVIARLDGDDLGENFEALALDNDGENLTIWVASDDNFMSYQRTVLLRFIWPGAGRLAAGLEGRAKPR